LLIKYIKKIGDIVVLTDGILLSRFQLKKDITRKHRFLKYHGLTAVFMGRPVAGERGGNAATLTVLRQLFLPSRPGMGNEPQQF
jgi:hypothetical protein